MVVLWIYHCTMCHQSMKRILSVQALQASQVFKVMLHYFYDLIFHATCKEHIKIKVSPNSKLHYVPFMSMNNSPLSCSFKPFFMQVQMATPAQRATLVPQVLRIFPCFLSAYACMLYVGP